MTPDKKIYRLSPYQGMIRLQNSISIHKSVSQLPVMLTVKPGFDFDIMKKAIAEEVGRNDCLRLHFGKRSGKIVQWFEDKGQCEVMEADFSDSTEEEQAKYLRKIACKPLKWMKGETAKFGLIRLCDGGCGLIFMPTHYIVDAFGIMIVLRDLLGIYFALKNGTEMPKPLCRFEDTLQTDLAIADNEKLLAAEDEFYRNDILALDKFTISQLNTREYREKNRQKISLSQYLLSCLNNKSGMVKYHRDAEFRRRVTEFCEKNGQNPMSLLYLAVGLYLSKLNGNENEFSMFSLINRRSKPADKNSGGCRMNGAITRFVLHPEVSAIEEMDNISLHSFSIMRHIGRAGASRQYDIINKFGLDGLMTLMFSYIPAQYDLPEGFSFDFEWLGNGYTATSLYFIVTPSIADGGLDFFFEYRKRDTDAEQVELFYNAEIRALELIMESPEMTVGELRDKL